MTGALALVGFVLTAFGWASQEALGEITPFALGQVLIGLAALAASGLSALVRTGRRAQPALRGPMLRVVVRAAAALAGAGLLYAGAAQVERPIDWTFEQRFTLSEASLIALTGLPEPLILTLYADDGDPRIRHTRRLLEAFANAGQGAGRGPVEIQVRRIDAYPEDEDFYGIGSSNSVVAHLGARWALVDRPREGSLYEAIVGLRDRPGRIVYAAVGAGEGDLQREGAEGYSGLGAALKAEGYTLRSLPLAVADAVPEDAAGLLVIAPQRPLPDSALSAIERFVAGGGALVAFLEPGANSGLEGVLARFGLASPDRWVVDPASLALEGEVPGLSPVASNYAQHPSTHGLGNNRMTFFRRARAFELRKAQPEDRLRGVVFTSGDAWTDPSVSNSPRAPCPSPPPTRASPITSSSPPPKSSAGPDAPASPPSATPTSPATATCARSTISTSCSTPSTGPWSANPPSPFTPRAAAAASTSSPSPSSAHCNRSTEPAC